MCPHRRSYVENRSALRNSDRVDFPMFVGDSLEFGRFSDVPRRRIYALRKEPISPRIVAMGIL